LAQNVEINAWNGGVSFRAFFFVCGEGPRSRSYGRTAVLRLIV
jgi:hypothetical protein